MEVLLRISGLVSLLWRWITTESPLVVLNTGPGNVPLGTMVLAEANLVSLRHNQFIH
jgi:hypothetical protein